MLAFSPPRARNSYPLAGVTARRTAQLFPTWEAGPAMKKSLFELNLISDMHRRLKPNRPAYQVVFEDERVDVSLSADAFDAEVRRVWPGAVEPVRSVFETRDTVFHELDPLFESMAPLVPAGFSERRALSKVLDRVPAARNGVDLFGPVSSDKMLDAALRAPLEFATYAVAESRSPQATCRVAGACRAGLFRLAQDIDDVRDLLLTAIREHAGAVVERSPGAAEISWSTVKGILDPESQDYIGCSFVIGPTRRAVLEEVLPESRKERSLLKSLGVVTPAARRFSVNLVVAVDVLPDGMFDDVFLIDRPGEALIGTNLVHASLGSVVGDVRPVTLDCILSLPPDAGDESQPEPVVDLQAIGRKMVALFRRIVPFLDRGLRAADIPWGEPTRERPHLVPWREAPVQLAGEPRGDLGLFGVPFETPYKNLFVVGSGSLPSLGFEGLFQSALDLAMRIHRSAGKKDVLS